MATVKEYIKANGYVKGDIITNPDDETETYTVGNRGRAPRFMMKLAGVPEKASKSVKAAKAAVVKATGKRSKNGSIILTNGTFYVNGAAVYAGEDTEIEVPAGAVISGNPPLA